jgi:hypothetical protein
VAPAAATIAREAKKGSGRRGAGRSGRQARDGTGGGQESDLARGSASLGADIICPNPQGTLEPEDGDGQSPRAESLVPQPALPRRRNGRAPPRRRLYLSSPRRRGRATPRASDYRASGQGDAPSGVRVPRLRPGGETHGRVSGALFPLRALRRGRPLALVPPLGINARRRRNLRLRSGVAGAAEIVG